MENQPRCQKCNEELEPGMKICPICQAPTVNTCQKCAKELKPNWVKCPWCETPVKQEPQAVKCQHCGEELEGGMVACPICGKKREGDGDSSQGAKEAGEYLEKLKTAKSFDDAIGILDEGIRKFPSNTVLLVRRAFWLNAIERYQDAIRDCDEAIRLEPENAEGYRQRSITYRNMKDYGKALTDANEAIRLDPSNGMCFGTRAQARKKKQDSSGALEDFNKAIELAGSDNEMAATFLNDRGDIFMEMENADAALQSYSRAIQLSPDSPQFLVNRADAYSGAEKYDEAIADYTKAIRLKPDYAYAYYARGDMYKMQEEYDRATADYSQALKLAPDFEPARHELANCLIEQVIKQYEAVMSETNDHFLPKIPHRMLTAATNSYAHLDEDEYIIYLHFWRDSGNDVHGHCFTNKGVHDRITGFCAYTDINAVTFKAGGVFSSGGTYADGTLLIEGDTKYYAEMLEDIVGLYHD